MTKLKELRTQAGLTQEALAERCEVLRVSMSRYDNGHRVPSLALGLRMAEELELEDDVALELLRDLARGGSK